MYVSSGDAGNGRLAECELTLPSLMPKQSSYKPSTTMLLMEPSYTPPPLLGESTEIARASRAVNQNSTSKTRPWMRVCSVEYVDS